jgi:ABC-type glutathione transport system ATPase component
MTASSSHQQTSADPEILLEGKGLERTFLTGEVAVRALRGVDISLTRGELVVLLGHSGSGKSTLLNILGGLDRATSGTLRFRRQGPDPRNRRRADPVPSPIGGICVPVLQSCRRPDRPGKCRAGDRDRQSPDATG